ATQNGVAASPIPIGGSCSESVTFAPLSVEQFIGAVGFTDDGGGATSPTTQFVQLQGTGKAANTTTTITSVAPNRVLIGQSVMISRSVVAEGGTLSPSGGMVRVQASTGESCMSPVMANACGLTFTTPGNRTITATYEGNASFNPSTSAPVTVDVADFGLSVAPTAQSISTKKATYTVTVTPVSGSSGTLALSCSGGPANATCAMSPSSVNLSGASTAKANLSLPNGAGSGTYTITFTGTFGTVTRSTTATLTVQ